MSKFEDFNRDCANNIDSMRELMRGKGVYDYTRFIEMTRRAQNCLQPRHLIDLFDEQIGNHLWEKFIDKNRNILDWMNSLESKARFFIQFNISEGYWE